MHQHVEQGTFKCMVSHEQTLTRFTCGGVPEIFVDYDVQFNAYSGMCVRWLRDAAA